MDVQNNLQHVQGNLQHVQNNLHFVQDNLQHVQDNLDNLQNNLQNVQNNLQNVQFAPRLPVLHLLTQNTTFSNYEHRKLHMSFEEVNPI